MSFGLNEIFLEMFYLFGVVTEVGETLSHGKSSVDLRGTILAELTANQMIITNVIIAMSTFIYGLIVLVISLMKCSKGSSRKLWFLTGMVFMCGSLSRMTMTFLPRFPDLVGVFQISNGVLAFFCTALMVCAWFYTDAIFFEDPERVRKDELKKIRKEVSKCKLNCGHGCTQDTLYGILDSLENPNRLRNNGRT